MGRVAAPAGDARHDPRDTPHEGRASAAGMAPLTHPEPTMSTNPSPFYAWLDHAAVRELVERAQALTPGERLVLVKGLVPGLVEAMGLPAFEEFVDEIRTKSRRFEEARTHPGEGHASRQTPGERVGGPTPEGHVHLDEFRDPYRQGGRAAEREIEAARWSHRVGETGEPSAG